MTDDNIHHIPIGELLARIDERTSNIARDLENLRRDFHDFKNEIEKTYVSISEFKSLHEKVKLHERILFGTIGTICLAVLGALLLLVIRNV